MRPLTRAHVAHVASETHVRASVSPRTHKHAVRINQGRIGEAFVIPTCRGQRLPESLRAVSSSFLFLFFFPAAIIEIARCGRSRLRVFLSNKKAVHILSYRKQLKCQHTFIIFFSKFSSLRLIRPDE